MNTVTSVNFVMPEIGEAVAYIPASKDQWSPTFAEVDKILEGVGPGQWVPITVETEARAMSLQHAAIKRGVYNNRRRKNVVFLQSATANEPVNKPGSGRGGRPRKVR